MGQPVHLSTGREAEKRWRFIEDDSLSSARTLVTKRPQCGKLKNFHWQTLLLGNDL
jgi:hypothetical protein